jgi:ketosteroid isomerase-like protein
VRQLRRGQQEYLDVGDDRFVVLLRQQGRPNGGGPEYDVPEAQVWAVRDGNVVDFEGYFDTSTVLRELQPSSYCAPLR